MTKRDAATVRDIGGDILHALGVQRGLELGGHETISITRVDEADEMDREQGHVEGDRNDHKAE
jgi:hypothetical protein